MSHPATPPSTGVLKALDNMHDEFNTLDKGDHFKSYTIKLTKIIVVKMINTCTHMLPGTSLWFSEIKLDALKRGVASAEI